MWARHFEIALGLWLVASPFIFLPDGTRLEWLHDFILATVLIVVPLFAYRESLRRIHLLLVLPALWLIGRGWLIAVTSGATPESQNHLLVGLVLAMLAIIPSHAARPPPAWEAGARG